MVKRSPIASSSKLQTQLPQGNQMLQRTIRRVLFSEGFKAYRPARMTMLTRKTIQDRLNFCKQYKDWAVQDGQKCYLVMSRRCVSLVLFVPYVRRQEHDR